MLQLSAYTAMLWGALSSSSSITVPVSQLRLPRKWLTVFCEQNLRAPGRHCRRAAQYTAVITFDGSLTGGGATLQVDVKNRSGIHTKPFIAYWADQRGPEDFALLQMELGDPAGQAKCGALTLLLSVTSWKHLLSMTQGSLTFVGVARGVLHDALRLRTREPSLNGVIGELALQLAQLGADVRAAHIWSECNITCDALSRLRQGTILFASTS